MSVCVTTPPIAYTDALAALLWTCGAGILVCAFATLRWREQRYVAGFLSPSPQVARRRAQARRAIIRDTLLLLVGVGLVSAALFTGALLLVLLAVGLEVLGVWLLPAWASSLAQARTRAPRAGRTPEELPPEHPACRTSLVYGEGQSNTPKE